MSASKLFTILAFLFVFNITSAKADNSGIQFEQTTWEQVKQKAKAENKHIFVDAYAVWCGPCKWMSANVFTNQQVADFYNKNYISFKFDMEKGDGPDFAAKYNVKAYPSLLYFNPSGDLVHQTIGASAAEDFITNGKNALNPETQVYTLKRKYEQGERGSAFIVNYLKALYSANEDAGDIALEYINGVKKKHWSKPKNWAIISAYLSDSSSDVYQYVAENREKFSKSNGAEQVTEYLKQGFVGDLQTLIQLQDESMLNDFKKRIKSVLKGEDGDGLIALTEMYFYLNNDAKAYDYIVNYYDNYCKSADELNSIAWNFFESKGDKAMLEKALGWVNKSIKIEQSFYNMDTKANLLHALGKNKEALTAAEKAVQLGKTNGEDTSPTEALADQIRTSLKG